MSIIHFTDIIKNTIEFLNQSYKIQNLEVEFQWLIFFKFLLNIFKDWIIYILTFQWIFDFVKYPIYVASWSESFFYDLIHNFFHNPPPSENSGFAPFENEDIFSFFSGFLNCFFLYLPFSPAHLIWLKRVLQNDKWIGRAASIGLICGNLSFLGFCLFGFRDFINLWFGFIEHFSYFFGVCLVFVIIFDMMHNPIRFKYKYPRKELFKIAIANFLLVWTDQPGIYQFFGNLSVSAGITPLDFSGKTTILYFLGIILGSFFWIFVIGFAVIRFGWILCYITRYKFTYPYWIMSLNRGCLIGSIALTLTSLPFYGFDYLFASPFGFISQDSIWESIPTLPKLGSKTVDTKKGRLGEKSSYGSLDVDLSFFDRGDYGVGPPIETHIESLNYKEEYAWRSRNDRISSTSFSKSGGLLNQYFNEQFGSMERAMSKQRQEKRKEEQLKRARRLQKKKKSLHFHIEDEPSFYTFKTRFINYNQSLIQRFIEDYTAEANKEDEEIPDLSEEKMIHFSAFSEIAKFGFDVFSIFEIPEADPFDEELFLDLKQKYSDNFIYKFFLHFDISNFMKRQPYKLSSKDEVELFKKRLALNEYYNTLRSYSKLPWVFKFLFCGPKSYSNRIYNQQFQGTLKFVERLFSIHLEKEQNIILTEEMEKKREQMYFLKDRSVLKFDQPLYKYKKDLKNPLMHEQLMEYLPSLLNEVNSVPFIQEENPIPFFVGWDNEQHKFLVTNRFLTRPKILSNITLPKNELQQFFLKLLKKNEEKSNMDFTFTSWPVNEQALQTNLFFNRLFRTRDDLDLAVLEGEDLFKYAEPDMDEDGIIYDKLPSIVERVDLKNPDKVQTSLIPLRGGFVWPGNFPLKFKINEDIITPLLKNLGFLK
uniref:Ycf1 n=1 Tax=Chlorodesmis fastigiata TaxID=189431 RepID=A0A2P0QIW1_CHLFS|nr:hypothetical protein [Chlorodesmis fastigiata]ARO74158.1 hypothetical protein [Chlorodesmis fastigiata]